ncbi:hypothetical protein [Nocardia sp. NBC_00508]|uniref:hypothetical protein n=1 Tax=Nocardia sp. NBC_00508 TaxID=2975992 RepID=UPI003FA604C3
MTHDVEEALLLADRAVVLRDARIAEPFDITVARPRSVVDPEFSALRRRLLLALGVNPRTDRNPIAGGDQAVPRGSEEDPCGLQLGAVVLPARSPQAELSGDSSGARNIRSVRRCWFSNRAAAFGG